MFVFMLRPHKLTSNAADCSYVMFARANQDLKSLDMLILRFVFDRGSVDPNPVKVDILQSCLDNRRGLQLLGDGALGCWLLNQSGLMILFVCLYAFYGTSTHFRSYRAEFHSIKLL